LAIANTSTELKGLQVKLSTKANAQRTAQRSVYVIIGKFIQGSKVFRAEGIAGIVL
jgi:hypothetical protein